MRERAGERDERGPVCAACAGPLTEPPARCGRCAAIRHPACVEPGGRCACGAALFTPLTRGAPAPTGEVGRLARREAVAWALALPFALVTGGLLLTSERLWTETLWVTSARGGAREELLGALARKEFVLLLVAYAVAPPVVGWLVRLRDPGAVAAEGSWASRAEWLARLVLLVLLARLTVWTWRGA
ncbi:MAG: hypothetical protein M9894_02875 [Planctomycetes bacterium]|nr:hypothetical protein [Planctomycetota bacterium]